MSGSKKRRGRPKAEIPQGEQMVFPPLHPAPAPEPTDRDRALQAETMRLLKEIDRRLTLQNLHRIQTLVALALRGQVPQELADHLCVIGRNYGDLADRGPRRPAFRVIEGRDE